MKISVVVPVRNEEESIRPLLNGLLQQSLQPDEIIIVDGGSTDATPGIVEEHAQAHPNIHLIREPNALPGRGRNIGANRASNEWLAFTDGGVVPEKDWLAQLAEAVRSNPETDVVFGRWEPITDTFFKECAAITYANVPTKKVDNRFVASRAVFSSLLRRSVWQAVNGFAAELRSAEDLLFMNRIDQAGFRTSYAPNAVVHWSMQSTWWRTFRRFVTYSRHNMRAGLWKRWQAALFLRYAVLIICSVVLIVMTKSWPIMVALLLWAMFIGRSTAALWRNREMYPASVARTVLRLVVIVPLLATIDAAALCGVLLWMVNDSFRSGKAQAVAEGAKS